MTIKQCLLSEKKDKKIKLKAQISDIQAFAKLTY